MTTHLAIKKSILPILEGSNIYYANNILYSSINNILFVTNTITGEIITKSTYASKITCIAQNNTINKADAGPLVGLSDGSLHPNYNSIHKSMITAIHSRKDYLITGSSDKTVRIYSNENLNLGTIYTKNIVTSVIKGDHYIFASDVEGNIYQYDLNHKRTYRFRTLNNIYKLLFIDSILYTFSSNNKLTKYNILENIKTGLTTDVFLDEKKSEVKKGCVYYEELEIEHEDVLYKNNRLFFIINNRIIEYSMDLKKVHKEYYLTRNVELRNLLFNDYFICITKDNEILFLDDEFSIKNTICGNNDEILDVLQDGNVLFVATNDGGLKCLNTTEGEGNYCCMADIIDGHEEAIMSIALFNNKLVTASRDNTIIIRDLKNILKNDINKGYKNIDGNKNVEIIGEKNSGNTFKGKDEKIKNEIIKKDSQEKNSEDTFKVKINEKESEKSKRIRSNTEYQTIRTHIDSVNCVDINDEILVSVGSDRTLQIFSYYPEINQLFTQVIHDKEINCVKINSKRRIIATASQDKIVKIFDYTGMLLHTLKGHKRGIWSLCFGDSLLASCSSDETIRIWSLSDFQCLKILEGHGASVLKIMIYDNDKRLISADNNGIIRTWDVRKNKTLGVFDFHKDKVWSLVKAGNCFISACGEGVLNILDDESIDKGNEILENIRVEKETKFELQILQREKKYIEALKIVYKFDDLDDIFRLVEKCVRGSKDDLFDEIFTIFNTDIHKMMNCLKKYLKVFKYCDVCHEIISEGIKRNCFNKSHKDLLGLIVKNYNSIDELSIGLGSLELLFKDIKNDLE